MILGHAKKRNVYIYVYIQIVSVDGLFEEYFCRAHFVLYFNDPNDWRYFFIYIQTLLGDGGTKPRISCAEINALNH